MATETKEDSVCQDIRVLWIKDRVYAALGIQEEHLFVNLLQRDELRAQNELLSYLDQPSERLYSPAVLFHVQEGEVEKEIEEVEGKCIIRT